MNLQIVTLESISERISSGGTPSRGKPEYFTADLSGHPWVKSKELLDSSIATTEEMISDEGLQNSAAKYFPEDTVLIAMYGANVGQLGWLAKRATVNQAICGLVIDERKANWRFVFYSLLLNRGDLTIQAQGAAQQNLNQDLIRQFQITLPTLPVQDRVAAILSAYDDLIENNLRRIKILEEMARALYREWFVEFRFPGHAKVPRVASAMGPIPKGWEVASLSSLVDFAKGRKPKETRKTSLLGDVKLLLIAALEGGANEFTSPEKLVIAGTHDTIMVMDGASSCDVAIGFSGAVGSTLGRFRVKEIDSFSPHALYHFLASNAEGFKQKNIGAAIPHANKDYILSQLIAIPPRPIMSQFDTQVTPIHSLIEINKARVQNLRRTRDLLLPRLLSGQIPIAEPTLSA